MKNSKFNFIFLMVLGMLLTAAPVQKADAQVSVSFQFFYDELSPYGNWISYPQYGYVWVPATGAGFRPYLSNGHWIFTDNGWMWASYYDWGWAPFHYGSWVLDPAFGWLWVPGYDWAPAWVTWGDYNGYYGWAPLQPGFSISISTYHPPIDYWCFMHPRYMTTAYYGDHFYVAHNRRIELGSNAPVINNVTNITVVNNVSRMDNTSYNAGPRRVDFENTAKVKVQPVAIRETAKPGKIREEGNAVSVYRPRVAKENVASEKPRKISSAEDVKRTNEVKRTNVESSKTNIEKDKMPANRAEPVQRPQPAQKIERKNQPDKMNGSTEGPRKDMKPATQTVTPQAKPRENERPQPARETQPVKPIPQEKQQPVPPRENSPEIRNRQPDKPAPVQQQQQREKQNQMNDRGNRRQVEQPQAPRREPAPRTNQPRRK